MLDLAEQDREDFVPLKDVADRQMISKKYLEIIVKDLVKARLLLASSGKGGGYKLSRPASEITVGEILEVSEGPFLTVACLAEDATACPRAAACKTLPLWAEYDKMTKDFFYSKKLGDLL